MATIWGLDMNTAIALALELLAAAPAVAKDLKADVQAWHDAHAWTGKTAAAAVTAAQLSEVLAEVAKAAGATGD